MSHFLFVHPIADRYGDTGQKDTKCVRFAVPPFPGKQKGNLCNGIGRKSY